MGTHQTLFDGQRYSTGRCMSCCPLDVNSCLLGECA